MNAPMQVSSSNSLISLAMTSSPGAAPAKPQLGAGTLVPRRHADRSPLHYRLGRFGARAHTAAVHSITSSARASSVGGIVRPSALAVLRLITSSNRVGCSTGGAAALAALWVLSP